MKEHAQENACIRVSVRFGPRGHAMEVENISTSMACPLAPQRTENLMLLQVRSARSGETSVMENRLKSFVVRASTIILGT